MQNYKINLNKEFKIKEIMYLCAKLRIRMNKKSLFYIITALFFISCGAKQEVANSDEIIAADNGDKTIYGLACDGCNDTIVVFLRLPYDGSDPDTLQILDAVKQKHIMGKIHIGDKLAIMQNEQDSTVADLVIVTEQLMGQWRYLEYPTLHQRADMEGNTERQKIAQLPDSIKALLDIPEEYGLDIKHDYMMFVPRAHTRNLTSDEESPIEYPVAEFFNEWEIFNGRFVMIHSATDSLGQMQILASDTADIELLEADSLMLRFKDGVRSYYRKVEEPKE